MTSMKSLYATVQTLNIGFPSLLDSIARGAKYEVCLHWDSLSPAVASWESAEHRALRPGLGSCYGVDRCGLV